MKKSELKVIYNCISNAQEAISELACQNYPFGAFLDDDLKKMFYELNSMCLKITEKMEGCELHV